MCGIVGLFPRPGERFEEAEAARSLEVMQRRGPDAEGLRVEEACVLGHRRLAIQDLDARSNQPMDSASGRYVISFNGEIYNVGALQEELRANGVMLRTTSDTEVILHLFEREGAAMLSRLRGMFAIIIWDRVARRAFLARDPYGIKPLYVATTPAGTLVASQVKGLLATGRVSREPDPRGQAAFWMLGSVAEPRTWFRDISAIQCGHYAWIEEGRLSKSTCWWDIANSWREPTRRDAPDGEVRASVREALRESIRAHLVADVPVGLLLSGGIDSGAIAGLMVDCGVEKIHAVTVTFPEFTGKDADEVPGATSTAEAAGLRHTIRPVTEKEFYDDLPRILAAIDQPSVDGINTWYATKAIAEQGLKVALSGVGGDELFLGYKSFSSLPSIQARWSRFSGIPFAMDAARVAARIQARRTGNSRWSNAPDWFRTIPGAWWARRGLFGPADLPELMGDERAREVLADFSPEAWIRDMSGALPGDPVLALAQIESTTYLRNQLLRDSDWASMDHSVELRTPLVDAWLLKQVQPMLGSFERYPKKQLLSRAPEKHLSDDVALRAKTGFGTPIQHWLASAGLAGRGEGSTRGWGRYLAQHLYAA